MNLWVYTALGHILALLSYDELNFKLDKSYYTISCYKFAWSIQNIFGSA